MNTHIMNTPKNFSEENESVFKKSYKTISDYLSEILMRGLKDRNVLIVDGLKYRLHGDKLIIDKNAAKSADIQGKSYKRVIELPLDKSEIRRRVELVNKLAKYGIKPEFDFDDFKKYLSQIELEWTEDLQKKMDLLKGKPYAPACLAHVVLLDKMSESEITGKFELADKLAEYGINLEYFDFDAFERLLSQTMIELVDKLVNYGIKYINVDALKSDLPQIEWTEDLQKKLNLLKGKPYAPFYVHNVVALNNIEESEVARRVELVDKLAEYGIKPENINFDAFERHLSQIEWTEYLKKKMDLLKGRPYAPFYAHDVVSLSQMDESEIVRRINSVSEMEKHGKNPENINFDSFEKELFS